MVASYRDLLVWQRALDLGCEVYALCDRLPTHERYGLATQLRRASVSVAANIAEGHSRAHRREFMQFLAMARGSQKEVEALLTVAARLTYIEPTQLRRAFELGEEVSKMLVAMRARLAVASPARSTLHAQQTARKNSSQSRIP